MATLAGSLDNLVAGSDATEETNEVKTWLKSVKLGRYFGEFDACGYDDMDQIMNMTQAQLEKLMNHVGMKEKLQGHRTRLLSSVEILRSSKSNPLKEIVAHNTNPSTPGLGKDEDAKIPEEDMQNQRKLSPSELAKLGKPS